MDPEEIGRRVGVFALLLVIVLGSSVAFAGGATPEAPSVQSLDLEAYSGDGLVADHPEETGEIELAANATGEAVLIDASHGSSMDREQLAPIVSALTESGAEVRFLSERHDRRPRGGSPFNASLRGADAFIAVGAEQGYSPSQVNGLEAFADAGGRVLLLKEPARMQVSFFFSPHPEPASVPMPLAPLASRFGVSFGNGYLYNMQEYATNYRNVYVTPANDGPLTEGVDRLVLHESTPVTGPTTVLRTIEGTELSETRATGQYGVAVRADNVTAVGDASLFGQAYYRRGDNEVFVSNVLAFLVTGNKTPTDAPAPPEPEEPPREPP